MPLEIKTARFRPVLSIRRVFEGISAVLIMGSTALLLAWGVSYLINVFFEQVWIPKNTQYKTNDGAMGSSYSPMKVSSKVIISLIALIYTTIFRENLVAFAKGFGSPAPETPVVQRRKTIWGYQILRLPEPQRVPPVNMKRSFVWMFLASLGAIQAVQGLVLYTNNVIQENTQLTIKKTLLERDFLHEFTHEVYSNRDVLIFPNGSLNGTLIPPSSESENDDIEDQTYLAEIVKNQRWGYFFQQGRLKKLGKCDLTKEISLNDKVISNKGTMFAHLSESTSDDSVRKDMRHLLQSLSFCTYKTNGEVSEKPVVIEVAGLSSSSPWGTCANDIELNERQALLRAIKLESILKDVKNDKSFLKSFSSPENKKAINSFVDVESIDRISIRNANQELGYNWVIQEYGRFEDRRIVPPKSSSGLVILPGPYSLNRTAYVRVIEPGECFASSTD